MVVHELAMARWLFFPSVISVGIFLACGGQVARGDAARSGSGIGGTRPSATGSGGAALAVGGDGHPATTGGYATGGVPPCADVTASTTISSQPVVEFLIDTGSSMADSDVPSTAGRSKWEVLQALLPATFAWLPQKWAVGVAYFNLPGDQSGYQGAQAVPIAPLTGDQLAAILASLAAVVPTGLTPTLAAWRFAFDEVSTWSSSALEFQASPRYIVLVTDSVPTVNEDGATPGSGPNGTITEAEYDDLFRTVAAGFEQDWVRTYVAGVPGSEDPEGAPYDPLYQLSQLAVFAGSATPGCMLAPGTVVDCVDTARQRPSTCLAVRGTYCHIDLTTSSDLATPILEAMVTIAMPQFSCAFAVPPTTDGRAIDPNGVTITFTPAGEPPRTLTRSLDDCGTGDWYFSVFDATLQPTELALCPNACQVLQGSEGASLRFVFACL